jgi:type II secretory pathway predicted ATPase ExeA/outer membrane protein OmpA-like peptidoglycan-associated protein
MYRSFYELKEKPFQITTDPRFLWLGEKHKEALSILKYGILDNKWFLLLTGDVGTGKTTLINALLKSLDDSVIVATVPDPGLDELDLFNVIADLYGIDRTFTSKGEFLIHFRRFLNDAHDEGKKNLLIIDEAQRLNQERLEVIRLLSNIERQETKLINIFFVGQNEFNDTLRRPENRALRQRITINYNITPLTGDETGEYISHRLKVAGASRQIFHPDAVRRVAAYTGGYPRLINVLCDYALVTGYVKGARLILPAVVDECARELQIPWEWPLPPAAAEEGGFPQPPSSPAQVAVPNAGASPPAAGAAPLRGSSKMRGTSSGAPSDNKSPVTVVKRQAQMPSKKPPRRTGLYIALGIVLALGALLYLMPGGLAPWSGHGDGAPGAVAKPPATAPRADSGDSGERQSRDAVVEPVTSPEISGTPSAATGSSDSGTSSAGPAGTRAPGESAAGGPAADTPVAVQPEPSPAASLKADARSTGASGTQGAGERPGGDLKSDSASVQPEPSPTASLEADRETSAGSRPLPAGETRPQETETAAVSTPPEKEATAGQTPLVAPSRTAETPGESAPAAGTLEDELRRLALEKKLLIYFGRNSNEMQQNTFAKLDALSVFMQRHPMARLVIRGYTDSSGVYSYNKKLSRFRANMVKSYLVGKGTDSGRIRTLGMGPANPLKSNKSEKTRRFNRRVEIEILMNSGDESG